MAGSAPVEFYGALGRIHSRDGGVDLRFYPFAFATESDARIVLIVRFEGAHFQTEELAGLLGDEVEATVFLDRAEVHSVFGGTTTILQASSVTAEWSAYDVEDLLQRVRQLQDEHDHLNRALAKSVTKNLKGLALVQELQRRAEIKAAASDDFKHRQASALAALERLLRHFEADD
ncbi:hypothetical protein ACFPIF_13020 [Brevundimonas faecalis]|uniref:hypothetical protein n=1 Tax=Brevundimonas faecalis TaxID=947378 RepID=UPI00360DFB16